MAVVPPRTAPPARVGPARPATVAVACLVPFTALAGLVASGWAPLSRLDVRVGNALHTVALDHRLMVDALKVVSLVAQPTVFRVLAVVAAVVLARRGMRVPAIFVGVTVLSGGFAANGVKILVGRPRPVWAHPVASASGLSFPSGHAFGITVAAATLLVTMWLVRGRAGPGLIAGCVAAVVVVAYSRVGLGVHYLSDVVGGILLGVAWCAVAVVVLVWFTARTAPATRTADL